MQRFSSLTLFPPCTNPSLIGIVAASMSTADGAILAMGTAWAHNVTRQLDYYWPNLVTPENLLMAARVATVPLTLASTVIADQVQNTAYLLIVAFDIVLASVVVPLFGCFYTKKPSPLAALLCIITGVTTRVVLEIKLPKDGFLVAPFGGDEFLNFGTAASSAVPPFWDFPEEERWNPANEECVQERYADLSGVDSLAAPIACLIVFVTVQFLERNGPIIQLNSLMTPYLKEGQGFEEEVEVLNEAPEDMDGDFT